MSEKLAEVAGLELDMVGTDSEFYTTVDKKVPYCRKCDWQPDKEIEQAMEMLFGYANQKPHDEIHTEFCEDVLMDSFQVSKTPAEYARAITNALLEQHDLVINRDTKKRGGCEVGK